MAPVTPQGRAAAARVEALTEKFKEDVLWAVREHGPVPPTLLHSYVRMVPGYSTEIVREAMWRLLDAGKIDLDSGLRLVYLDTEGKE